MLVCAQFYGFHCPLENLSPNPLQINFYFPSEYSWGLFYFVFKPSLIWHRRAEKREIKTCDLIWVHSACWQITVSYSVMFKPIFRSTFYLCSMSLRPTTIWSYIRDCTNPKKQYVRLVKLKCARNTSFFYFIFLNSHMEPIILQTSHSFWEWSIFLYLYHFLFSLTNFQVDNWNTCPGSCKYDLSDPHVLENI